MTLWITNREVVFRVRVVRDVHAKLCASYPGYRAPDPCPAPAPLRKSQNPAIIRVRELLDDRVKERTVLRAPGHLGQSQSFWTGSGSC